MGVIDKTIHTIDCYDCHVSEEQKVLEQGSQYGSSWQNGVDFQYFDVTWNGGGNEEPHIIKAICKKCLKKAFIKERFGGI